MILEKLNNLPLKELYKELGKCCGSSKWIKQMTQQIPFKNEQHIRQCAEECWATCSEIDWLEAFGHHPRIGEKEIEEKFSSTSGLASSEQSGIAMASKKTISGLVELNDKYFQKFGFIFIIFATGKSAEDMFSELKIRIKNDRKIELKIAAGEQLKIMQLRLEKMFG